MCAFFFGNGRGKRSTQAERHMGNKELKYEMAGICEDL